MPGSVWPCSDRLLILRVRTFVQEAILSDPVEALLTIIGLITIAGRLADVSTCKVRRRYDKRLQSCRTVWIVEPPGPLPRLGTNTEIGQQMRPGIPVLQVTGRSALQASGRRGQPGLFPIQIETGWLPLHSRY